ncbi:MAG: hypothetical protein FJW14_17975 [Acidimicrobiia bacterium]|nr:hypothetical protein [Acidimicrobiia bacterium]
MRFVIGVALLALGAVTAGSTAAQQDSTRAVATVGEVMATMTVPASAAVFRAASEAPREEKDWTAVRGQAIVLAESGNLLLIGSRVRTGDWSRMAVALREAAETAVRSADSRNATALSDAGEQVYETCEQCHSRYLQP